MKACSKCGHVDADPATAPRGSAVARWNLARDLFLRVQGHGDQGQWTLLRDDPKNARSHLRFIQDAVQELERILRADQASPSVDPTPIPAPVDAQRRIV